MSQTDVKNAIISYILKSMKIIKLQSVFLYVRVCVLACVCVTLLILQLWIKVLKI